MTLYRRRFGLVLAGVLALGAGAGPLAAQLRPLDPMDGRAFDPGVVGVAGGGGDDIEGPRASAAGTRGRAVETPAAILSWTQGRLALRAIVHPLRMYWEDTRYAPALPGADTAVPGRHRDAGDNVLETVIRLTPDTTATSSLLALRYGVRIPTHNDRLGIDRHKTDFYLLLGGRAWVQGWSLSGEAGLGVYGARQVVAEKALPFVYALGLARRFGAWQPALDLVGQAAAHPPRGNENLSELRAGARVGRARWVELMVVKGLARYSPDVGVILFGGVELPRRRTPRASSRSSKAGKASFRPRP